MTTFCGDSIQSGGLQKTFEAHGVWSEKKLTPKNQLPVSSLQKDLLIRELNKILIIIEIFEFWTAYR